MTPLEQANLHEINRLKNENEIMRKLATREGFFQYYFQQCKHHSTNAEAFNFVNDLYESLFGEHRYGDYNSFKVMTNYYLKPKK